LQAVKIVLILIINGIKKRKRENNRKRRKIEMNKTIPNTKIMNWEEISPEHLEEMINFAGTPITRIIYALYLLSDIVDKDMVGEERNKHIRDIKIIVKNYLISNEPPIINDLNNKIKNLELVRDKLHHEKKI